MKAPDHFTLREEAKAAIKNKTFASWPTALQKDALYHKKDGETLVHFACRHGLIDSIPKELLTKKRLFEGCPYADYPLEVAANFKTLKKVFAYLGEDFLNQEELLIANETGKTLFHIAVTYDVSQVPEKWLIQQTLFHRNPNYPCVAPPFFYIARHGNLQKLPKEVLSLENLTEREVDEPGAWTALDYLSMIVASLPNPKKTQGTQGTQGENNPLESLLKKLSSKTLSNLQTHNRTPKPLLPWIGLEVEEKLRALRLQKIQDLTQTNHKPLF